MNFFPKIFKQMCMSCRYTISFPVCLPYVRYTWWLSATLLVLNPYFRTHFWAESTNLNSASLHEKTCLYTVRLLSQSGRCNSIYLLFFISRHSACGTRTLVSFFRVAAFNWPQISTVLRNGLRCPNRINTLQPWMMKICISPTYYRWGSIFFVWLVVVDIVCEVAEPARLVPNLPFFWLYINYICIYRMRTKRRSDCVL